MSKHTEYTEGKLTSSMREIRHKDRGIIIANIYPHLEGNMSLSEQIANAERFVKCWNMHDELVETLKFLLENFDNKKNGSYAIVKANKLINQSEQ